MHSMTAEDWLKEAFGLGSPVDILRRLAGNFWKSSIINQIKNGHGRIISGRLLMEWGKLAGIKEVKPGCLSKWPTYITPCQGGFRMTTYVTTERQKNFQDTYRVALERDPAQRWIFAHEIGHTFFYDRTFDPPQKTYGRDETSEEALCQKFAAELLLPYERLIKEVPSVNHMTVEFLISLVFKYGAPLRAIVRRLICDLAILQATCVIINKPFATSWHKKCISKNLLSNNGIEIFEPPHSSFRISEERLQSDEVIKQVCSSRSYWCSDYCEEPNDGSFFVEGLMLNKVAPRMAAFFLFHEVRPTFTNRTLFDTISS